MTPARTENKKRPPSFRPNRILRALSIRSNRADSAANDKDGSRAAHHRRGKKSSSLPKEFVGSYGGGSYGGPLSQGSYHGPLSGASFDSFPPTEQQQQQQQQRASAKASTTTTGVAALRLLPTNSLLARSILRRIRLPRRQAAAEPPRWVDNKNPHLIYELLFEIGKGACTCMYRLTERSRDACIILVLCLYCCVYSYERVSESMSLCYMYLETKRKNRSAGIDPKSCYRGKLLYY
jgi:hypothetical protein